MKFIEKIFSIKYKNLHKIINVFGIKIKLKTSFYPTNIFIQQQYSDNNEFDALDVCVRYGFIDEYIKMGLSPDNYWSQLYIKMQTKRGTVNSHNIKRFVELIESYKKNKGYSKEFPVFVNKNGLIDDGSHRTALNLYFKEPYIKLALSNREFNKRNYGLTWFKNNDFTNNEIEKILFIKNKILGKEP